MSECGRALRVSWPLPLHLAWHPGHGIPGVSRIFHVGLFSSLCSQDREVGGGPGAYHAAEPPVSPQHCHPGQHPCPSPPSCFFQATLTFPLASVTWASLCFSQLCSTGIGASRRRIRKIVDKTLNSDCSKTPEQLTL